MIAFPSRASHRLVSALLLPLLAAPIPASAATAPKVRSHASAPAPKHPETAACLILDAVIAPYRPDLGIAASPFVVDPLGTIAGDDLVRLVSSLEAARGLVGQQGDDAP